MSAEIIPSIITDLQTFCDVHKLPDDHGMSHFLAVFENAKCALEIEKLSNSQNLCILLASLLHDVDDKKFFKTINNKNARDLLMNYVCEEQISLIIEMISLVSTSENGNSTIICKADEKWKLIPRDCDRIEALGNVGINRCYEYTLSIGNPIYTDSTPLPVTTLQLEAVCHGRFDEYQKNKKSISMIDHFYDKLLHLHKLSSGNKYLQEIADQRHTQMVEWLIEHNTNLQAKRYPIRLAD